MKTLTELSGTLVRMAAAAIAEARRSLPREEASAPAERPPQEEPAGSGAGPAADAAPDTSTEADAAPGTSTEAGVPAEAPPAEASPAAKKTPAASAPEPAESEAVKAALDAAVAKATGLSGERLGMLRAAVEAAGRRAEDVRLVRVFGPEEQVAGATAIGGHQYLVDLFPASMKQVAGGGRESGRRGGRGRGGGGGGRGGKGAPATGGFSMDSLREDRRNERGRGRPGGGRRPGPGGPPRSGPAGGEEK